MPSKSTRTVVITGASDGIGAAASRQLAAEDVRLILVGRSLEKTSRLASEIGAEYHLADFTRLDDVRDLAAALQASCDRIDVLANNAGGMFSGPTTTVDGFEETFQVNHLAPYLLTNLLIDVLLASRASVVNTASIAARLYGDLDFADLNNWQKFSPNRAYGNGKLANILFTKGLHRHFHAQGLSSVAFHPGVVATNFASATDSYLNHLYHSVLKVFLVSPEQGGGRLRHFIDGRPDDAWVSGEYYVSPKKIGQTNPQAYDPAVVEKHWETSAALLGIQW